MTIRCGVALTVCALYCFAQFGFTQAAHAGPAPDRSSWSPVSVLLAKGKQTFGPKAASARQRSAQASDAIPPLPVRKTANGTGEAIQPDVWSEQEIKQALDRCTALLKNVDAVVEHLAPIKDGKCGTAAPVRLVSLGKKLKVTFSPPALVNCRMVAALHKWIEKDVQPLARKHLGARIVKVSVMSDYSCRRSSGRRNRWSEHAFVDALDIRGFETEIGQKINVLDGWGMTERDIAAHAAAAKAEAEAQAVASAVAKKTGGDVPDSKAAKTRMELAAAKLGGPGDGKNGTAKVAALAAFPAFLPSKGPKDTRNGHFLRAAHASACRIFGTTLGPEANEAHRNHFHVDMAERKYKKICD